MNLKPCSVCQHREVQAINAQLRLGTSLRKIEGLFNVTRPSLSRHGKHLPPVGISAVRAEPLEPLPVTPEIAAAAVELAALQESHDDDASVLVLARRGAANLHRIAVKAERANSLGIAIQAWAKHREYLDLVAKLTGELEQTPTNTFNFTLIDSFVRKAEVRAGATTIDITPAKQAAE